ncbi:MAG: manganese efflux pump [Lachnospiraceae bacterium]|nr:manganese efflux pump [Lachnospiraceae bacterium]
MEWLECVLIVCGISFDVFAQMECQGSLVANIKKAQIIKLCLAVVAWQFIALFLGHSLANLLVAKGDIAGSELILGQVMSAVILVALGVRQIFVSQAKLAYVEKREDTLSLKKMLLLLGRVTMYTILTGIALAFSGANVVMVIVSVALMSVLAVTLGAYAGYNFGFEHKAKAYVAGAAILIIIGAELLIKTLMTL